MTKTAILELDPRITPIEPFGALIFDCDGTLADTMPTHFIAWVSILRKYGGDLSEELFYGSAGRPTRDIIEHLNQEFGYDLDVETIYREKEAHYLTLINSIKEIKAVADVARAYHERVPLAVASGGAHLIVDQTLDAIGVKGLFSAIVGADDVVNGKPAPDMFLLAAERVGVAPTDCIVYEDGEPGIVAARAAGMRVIDVRTLFAH